MEPAGAQTQAGNLCNPQKWELPAPAFPMDELVCVFKGLKCELCGE